MENFWIFKYDNSLNKKRFILDNICNKCIKCNSKLILTRYVEDDWEPKHIYTIFYCSNCNKEYNLNLNIKLSKYIFATVEYNNNVKVYRGKIYDANNKKEINLLINYFIQLKNIYQTIL